MNTMASRPMTASIVIPCRNELGHLQATLDSILGSGLDARHELIVIDDGSVDGTSSFLPSPAYSRVTLLRQPNEGAAQARNRGAELSHGDVLVFCDAHVRVPPGWLDALLSVFGYSGVDAVCTSIASQERPQDVGFGGTWDDRLSFKWLGRSPVPGLTQVPFAPSGCVAVRRSVFFDVGGFQRYFRVWGFEDQEFSLRLWLFGYQVYAHPDIKVLHYFRPRHPYAVTFAHVDFNMLWMAFVHFNPARFSRTAALITSHPGFSDLVSEIIYSSVAQGQRAEYMRRRRFDDDWFMQRFHIPF